MARVMRNFVILALSLCSITVFLVSVASYFATLVWARGSPESPEGIADSWAESHGMFFNYPPENSDRRRHFQFVIGVSSGTLWCGCVSETKSDREVNGSVDDPICVISWVDSLVDNHSPWKRRSTAGRFPLWIAFVSLAIYPGIVFVRGPVRRRRRRAGGRCVACGYNLTGNVSGICPECGTPCPQKEE